MTSTPEIELHGGRSKTKVPTVGDIYGYFYFGTTHSAYKTKKHVDPLNA